MRPPPRAAVTAVILAGGEGRRLGGRDKAWIRWRGEALIRHLLRELRPQAAHIVISANRNLPRLRRLGVRVVRDRPPVRSGPLAGWNAAFRTVRSPWILSLPVDAPCPPRKLLRRLASGGPGGAYAVSAQGPHYLHALLPSRKRACLARFCADGGRAAGNWVRSAGLVEVRFRDRGVLWSLNDADDLRRLRRKR